jgi:DNA helicase HerA-like ATPase
MFSKSVAIVGMTGTGKNYNLDVMFLRKMPSKKKYIADVSREYNIPFYGIDNFMEKLVQQKITVMPDKTKRIELITKVKDSLIVIDEATLFFDSHKNKELEHLLVSKRHDNNFIILLFHSLSDFPPTIKRKIDYIVLLKTADDEPAIIKKFGRDTIVHKCFLELQESPNLHDKRIIKLI